MIVKSYKFKALSLGMATATEEKPLSLEQERAAGAEPEAPSKPRPVYFKEAVSSVQGLKNYLHYKVSADQWFGTFYQLAMGYSIAQGLIASLKRQGAKDGENPKNLRNIENKKNLEGAIGACLALSFTVWSLLSSRSAVPPNGQNYIERIFDVVKHPERSQHQLFYLLNTITNAFYEIGNIKYGFTKAAMPEEKKTKQMQAVITPLAVTLGFTDLFEDKAKRSAQNKARADIKKHDFGKFSTSQSKIMQSKWLYPVRVLRESWRNNPKRILSLVVGLIFPLTQLQEGLDKRHAMQKRFHNALKVGSEDWLQAQKELQDAGKAAGEKEVRLAIEAQKPKKMKESNSLLKKGGVSTLVGMASAFYSLDQLYKGEKMKEGQREGDTSHQAAERKREPASSGVSR